MGNDVADKGNPELETIAALKRKAQEEWGDILEITRNRLTTESIFDQQLDIRGVAEMLKCSVSTVERLTRAGSIPSFKVGRLRRYNKNDVMKSLRGPAS